MFVCAYLILSVKKTDILFGGSGVVLMPRAYFWGHFYALGLFKRLLFIKGKFSNKKLAVMVFSFVQSVLHCVRV